MSKSVPTLVGVVIILVAVVLVVLVYNIRLTRELVKGGSVVGTVGGEILTGEEQPTEEISPYEALGERTTKRETVSPRPMQSRNAQQGGRTERQGARRGRPVQDRSPEGRAAPGG